MGQGWWLEVGRVGLGLEVGWVGQGWWLWVGWDRVGGLRWVGLCWGVVWLAARGGLGLAGWAVWQGGGVG